MCNMYDTILSPIDYGGLQLKNRIIFAPTTFGLSDEEYLAEMERLAKGGCAMIIIGDVPRASSRSPCLTKRASPSISRSARLPTNTAVRSAPSSTRPIPT